MIKTRKSYFYIFIFFLACVVFWWSPSIALYAASEEMYLRPETLGLSFFAFGCYVLGYVLFCGKHYPVLVYNKRLLKKVNILARWITLTLSAPSLVLAVLFYIERSTVAYGDGDGIPLYYQAFFYSQLSFFFIYIASSEERERRRLLFLLILGLTIAIRLIVSMKWGRFFLVQAVFPVFMLYVARGWLLFSLKNTLIFVFALLFVFFVPSYMRGDFDAVAQHKDGIDFNKLQSSSIAMEYLQSSSTLKLFEENIDTDFSKWCNPLLVSLTQKIVPYKALNVCVMNIWREEGLATTLDRILAYKELGPELSQEVLNGPGSNYLLESYVSLGGVLGIAVISFLSGLLCAISFSSLASASLFGSLWLEILTRCVLIPRGNFGYMLERMPMLFLSIVALVLFNFVVTRQKHAS